MHNFRLHISIFVLILSLFSSWAFAMGNVSGEIININQQYKIAFTDLSSPELRVGDIVEVSDRGQFITYLKVSEASNVISKLVAITQKGEYQTKVDFKDIKVGNSLKKIINNSNFQKVEADKSINLSADSQKLLNNTTQKSSEEIQKLSDNYAVLFNNLVELTDEKKSLEIKYKELEMKIKKDRKSLQEIEIKKAMVEEENKALKASLKKMQNKGGHKQIKSLKKTVGTLKKKLERMAQLIEGL